MVSSVDKECVANYVHWELVVRVGVAIFGNVV
jgi:hypothetical protein